MKHLATVALMLNLGVASLHAQERPVNMTFSGSNVATTINLQPNTVTDEVHLAGNGRLGPFTFRELHADDPSQPSSSCSGPSALVVAGAGVFRFQDGSLLTVGITGGAVCVDLTAGVGHLTVTYKIMVGTGRFKGASGNLTLTASLIPVLFNASNAPELLINTGEFTGTVSGVAVGEEGQDQRQ
jgi:hypothetical protein